MNLQDLNPLIDDLASAVQQKVGFKSMPSITLQDDEDNADVLLGKTAYYDPQNKAVTVYVTNRHPKDILRSIAHELIHHGQNLRGEFDKIGAVGEGYAQNDEHLRNMEKEAYLKGNMCFRDWEDGYKRQMMESIHRQNSFKRRSNKMRKYKTNKNNELNKLLMEKFNFGGKKKEYDLEEGADRIFAPNHYCAHHVVHEGQEAYTVDHNWDEQLQEVTEYDIRFKDGTVKRDVPVAQLEILQAFNESHHGNRDENGEEDKSKHPPVKSAKKKKGKYDDGDGKDEKCDYVDCGDKDDKKIEESELPDLFNVTRRRGRGSNKKSRMRKTVDGRMVPKSHYPEVPLDAPLGSMFKPISKEKALKMKAQGYDITDEEIEMLDESVNESELSEPWPERFTLSKEKWLADKKRLRKTVDGRMVPISHYPNVPLDVPLPSLAKPISKKEALKLKAQGYDITDEEIAELDITVNESFRREVRKLMEEVLKLK